MDRRTLQAFLHLADTLNFNKASQLCFISPPTLTRVIQRLEQEYDTVFFERTNKYVSLTPEGEVFYRFARDMLQHLNDIYTQLHEKNPKQIEGSIAIHATMTASSHYLAPFIRTFNKTYPKIDFDVYIGSMIEGKEYLVHQKTDFVIALETEANIKDTTFVPIDTIEFDIVVPSDRVEDYREALPALMLDYAPFHQGFADIVGDNPRGTKVVPSYIAITAMVGAGLGWSIIPRLTIQDFQHQSLIKVLPSEIAIPSFKIGFLYRNALVESHLHRLFVDYLNTHITTPA